MKSLLARLGGQGGEAFHRCGRPEVVHNLFCRPNRWRGSRVRRRVGAGRFARWRGVGMVGLVALGVVSACMAAGPPRLEPLVQVGKWPCFTRGEAYDVKAVGSRAYVALGQGGLAILDVSNPASPVRLGGYDTSGTAYGVAVSGTMA